MPNSSKKCLPLALQGQGLPLLAIISQATNKLHKPTTMTNLDEVSA